LTPNKNTVQRLDSSLHGEGIERMHNNTAATVGVACDGRTSALSQALVAAQNGWHLVRIHGQYPDGSCTCRKGKECGKDAGKHPANRSWNTRATTDTDTIRRWFGSGKPTNYGIATGRISGVIVLDFDTRNGGEDLHENLMQQHDDFRTAYDRTYRVLTPGGCHVYFQAPSDRYVISTPSLLPGLDIRAENGCVVGAGTKRAGKEYRQLSQATPADVVPCPDSILALLKYRPGDTCHTRDTRNTRNARDSRDTRELKQQTEKPELPSKTGPTFPANIGQDVSVIMADTLPTSAGVRHRKVFELARKLRSLPGMWDADFRVFRDVVRQWQELAERSAAEAGFTIAGGFEDSWGEFARNWQNIRSAEGQTMADVVEDCAAVWKRYQSTGVDSLPVPVRDVAVSLQYSGDVIALVLLCHGLSTAWPNGVFPLACRTAADGVLRILQQPPDDQAYQTASRRLRCLVADGVLNEVTPSIRATRRATEYAWRGFVSGK
jgi:hypothetical protein